MGFKVFALEIIPYEYDVLNGGMNYAVDKKSIELFLDEKEYLERLNYLYKNTQSMVKKHIGNLYEVEPELQNIQEKEEL